MKLIQKWRILLLGIEWAWDVWLGAIIIAILGKMGKEQYNEEEIWMYGSTNVDGSTTIDQEVEILRGSTKQ